MEKNKVLVKILQIVHGFRRVFAAFHYYVPQLALLALASVEKTFEYQDAFLTTPKNALNRR